MAANNGVPMAERPAAKPDLRVPVRIGVNVGVEGYEAADSKLGGETRAGAHADCAFRAPRVLLFMSLARR